MLSVFARRAAQPALLRPSSLSCLRSLCDQAAPSNGSGGRHFRHNISSHPLKESLPKHQRAARANQSYTMAHPIWSDEEVNTVNITHHKPQDMTEKLAYYTVQALRLSFDILSGYKFGHMDEIKWLRRIIFLETVAGVPGMMGAMVRHLSSLRTLQRDHGWIHTLLEEAENERMHLLTALELRKPGKLFRWAIVGAQGFFTNLFFIAYLISPRYCHRFVGYLEEEAVKTYTRCLGEIDSGHLKMWCKMPAPDIAIKYWQLKENAMMRDVILALRADEAHHRMVNHTFGGMKPHDPNPYNPGR